VLHRELEKPEFIYRVRMQLENSKNNSVKLNLGAIPIDACTKTLP